MCNKMKKQIENENIKIDEINIKIDNFLNSDNYIYSSDMDELIKSINIEKIKFNFFLTPIFKYMKYLKKYNKLNMRLSKLSLGIEEHNNNYIKLKKELFKKVCGDVEGRVLDDEQIDAIVREDRNQLVIAGAGCGKTTTIVGKVKYLVKALNVNPQDILLLSFTEKSADDMKQRVENEIGQNVECYTFHKLGLDIAKLQLPNLNIYNNNINRFIKNQINILVQDKNYLNSLVYFITENIHLIKDEFSIRTDEEYRQYIASNPPITIKGEIVKSYGEMEIANFLFYNNIKYEYEAKYKYKTDTTEYGEYHPDFYLPDYDIYVEYFGIDRNHNVPSYYTSKHGKTPKEEYNDGIAWKRETHKNHGTILIELYYYQNKEGILKETLRDELKKYNVELKQITLNDVFKCIKDKNKGILDGLASSFETIINLIKSNNYKIQDLKNKSSSSEYKDNICATLNLIEPIYDEYDELLARNKMIDFNDMINVAIDAISSGLFINKFKYVIVDEFQDISNSRYKLLKQLRESNDYKLYCVGDDFQSIYRFNGSNIGIFTNFEKYFGEAKINIIGKTHRFSFLLSTISGEFIMKNPNQIKKRLNGYISDFFPISEVCGYSPKYIVKFLQEKLDYLETNSSVLFLGRYNFDLDMFNDDENFNYKKEEAKYKIIYKNRKDLNITFMTIHGSKGLEADYVVILNNRNSRMGFPSRISELPVMTMLLDNSDNYPFSEERRLFYVAMTRARKKVFLLVDNNKKSIFIKELENTYSEQFKKEKYTCPKCGGKLLTKTIVHNKFIGCTNYPNCNYIKKL